MSGDIIIPGGSGGSIEVDINYTGHAGDDGVVATTSTLILIPQGNGGAVSFSIPQGNGGAASYQVDRLTQGMLDPAFRLGELEDA
ncbi:MAG: hypothetical protein ING71_17290 [Rhodocyclaceae bacterium]|nr:hypothetical protein [Rhodocyclaceae bacterium]